MNLPFLSPLKFLIQRLLILLCLLSVLLFSQKALSDRPTPITKEKILQLAFVEGILDEVLDLQENLQEIPLKGKILNFSKLDLKKIKFGFIMDLLSDKGIRDFSNWDLSGLNLMGVDFMYHADSLDNVNFKGTNLDMARFAGKKMRNILTDKNTSVDMTDFSHTDLRGADLSQLKDWDEANWDGAKYDKKTKFPPNFKPKAEGMIKIKGCQSLF